MDECVVCGKEHCVIEIWTSDKDGNNHEGLYCDKHSEELQREYFDPDSKLTSISVMVHARPRSDRPPRAPENPIAWLIRRLTNARP